MTGGDLARRLVGRHNVQLCPHPNKSSYEPRTGKVSLDLASMQGSDMQALMVAAHECAHRLQHLQHPWLFRFRWFVPVALWLEWQAWTRAYEVVSPILKSNEDKDSAYLMRWMGLDYL